MSVVDTVSHLDRGDEIEIDVGSPGSYRGVVDDTYDYEYSEQTDYRVDVQQLDWDEWFAEARLRATVDDEGESSGVTLEVVHKESVEEWDSWDDWRADREYSVDDLEVVD